MVRKRSRLAWGWVAVLMVAVAGCEGDAPQKAEPESSQGKAEQAPQEQGVQAERGPSASSQPGPSVQVRQGPGASSPQGPMGQMLDGNVIGGPPPAPRPHGPPPQIPGDPPGRRPEGGEGWAPIQVVAELPRGGHRPQIAIDSRGGLHLVYYARVGEADVVLYREGPNGATLGDETAISQLDEQNWGPDLVMGPEDRPWVSYDHARANMTGQVFVVHLEGSAWSSPERVSQANGKETSSSHLAFDGEGALTVVWLSRTPGARGRSAVLTRRRSSSGRWSDIRSLYKGNQDALHSNIVRGPDGIQVVGFDFEPRPDHRQVHLALGVNGRISPFVAVGDAAFSTERPNFGFGPGNRIFSAWTDALNHDRIGVSYTAGVLEDADVSWTRPVRPSRGLVGRHYDPDIAGNSRGQVMLVWGWQFEGTSSILYARWRGERFETPRQIQARGGMASLPSIYAGPDDRFHLVWNQGGPEATEVLYSVVR